MRLLKSVIAFGLFSIAHAAPGSSGEGNSPRGQTLCDRNARGPHLEAKQQAALADYVHWLYERKEVRKAFDRWVPGEYIQHNPFAEPGREFAITFLANSLADPGTLVSNVKVFGGQGYGAVHLKLVVPTATWAVLDYFRFKGTCIIEHWDVLQQITGNEPNPIAFF